MPEKRPKTIRVESPPKNDFETPTTQNFVEGERSVETQLEWNKQRIMELNKSLSERCENGETFTFPGISQEAYKTLSEENKESLDFSPEYWYDLDKLLEKFNVQGFRVVVGKNPINSQIFPSESDDILDMLRPKHLKVHEDMNSELKELLILNQSKS